MRIRIDRPEAQLWLTVAGLLALSLVTLWTSIPAADGTPDRSWAMRQAVFVAASVLLAAVASRIPLQRLLDAWKPIWLAAVGSTVLVFLLGSVTRGSRRWIEAGPINIQPSEFAKVMVVVAAAAYLSRRSRTADQRTILLAVAVLVGIPAAMVFLQPDLGTAQVYGAIGFSLLYFAGTSWRILGLMVGSVLGLGIAVMWLLPAVGIEPLEPHQRDRLLAFANPEDDPQGVAYHVIQSRIAIGSGGLTGRSSDEPTQTGQQFLPEPHTDFVFATVVERSGFLGGALLLGLLGALLWRCLAAVSLAPDVGSRLVAGGILGMFSLHIIVNVGMTMGLVPITGVPLPFVSYGGSAMITNMVAIGIVAGILRSSESARVRYARRIIATQLTSSNDRRTARAQRRARRMGTPVSGAGLR